MNWRSRWINLKTGTKLTNNLREALETRTKELERKTVDQNSTLSDWQCGMMVIGEKSMGHLASSSFMMRVIWFLWISPGLHQRDVKEVNGRLA
ncbi:hypothetical protein Hdeb2414_s0007g00261401 [Helianthus debilis subsp. tardiflorus]